MGHDLGFDIKVNIENPSRLVPPDIALFFCFRSKEPKPRRCVWRLTKNKRYH
jgi:hypothetical protein